MYACVWARMIYGLYGPSYMTILHYVKGKFCLNRTQHLCLYDSIYTQYVCISVNILFIRWVEKLPRQQRPVKHFFNHLASNKYKVFFPPGMSNN